MSRYMLVLHNDLYRRKAQALIDAAPLGSRVEVKSGPKRSMPQNDKMWAMLTEVSRQVKWHGQRLKPDDWKLIFLDGLKRELRIVPNLDGDGFVNLGRSSSDLSKDEMGDLLELITAWGVQHDVVFAERGGSDGKMEAKTKAREPEESGERHRVS